MVALLALIVFIVRLSNFRKLTLGDLPLLSETDLQQMKKASKTALLIFIAFTVLSLIPFALQLPATVKQVVSIIFAVVGLAIAATFDSKAERIKKKGKKPDEQKGDQVQWYHVLVSILLPYVGLPWGIVNLCKKRSRSGKALVIISTLILLVVLFAIIFAPKH